MNSKSGWEETSLAIKELVELTSPMSRIDDKLYFYYDESNNIRLYRLKQGKFNHNNINFSLAGVVTKEKKEFSIQDIFDILKFKNNDNFNEFKFKHIAKKRASDIFEALETKKFSDFLTLLKNEDLYIHVSVLNVFYYGIVDIVDDIVRETQYLDKQFIDELKNFVYLKMYLEYEKFADLFFKYHYPNIQSDESIEFLGEIKGYFEEVSTGITTRQYNDIWLECLSRKIEAFKVSEDQLILLSDNQNDILIKNFSELYNHKLFAYDNSTHLFDEETEIISYWDEIGLSNSSISKRYKFKKSDEEIMLQISDVIAGIFAKLFDYLANNSIYSIKTTVSEMDKHSLRYQNLELLFKLIKKTNEFDSYLLQFIVPISLKKKFDVLCSLFL